MFEFRWADDGNGNLQLQQRTCKFTTDAAGAFCGTTPWSEWDSVPIVRGAGVLRPVHNVFQSWDERERHERKENSR